MATEITIAEVLRAGKAHLLEYGWCQGDQEALFGKSGRCCAATAISSTREYDLLPRSARPIDFFRTANNINFSMGVGGWNDAPERTFEDVLAAYDKAIAAAEEIARGHQE